MQTQLDIYQQDKTVVEHLEQQKKEISELTFENQTLRKDIRELTSILKDYQELEFRQKQADKHRHEKEMQAQEEIERRLQELESEKVKTVEERKRADALRLAFDADKQAMQDRMKQLEGTIQEKDEAVRDLNKRLGNMESND